MVFTVDELLEFARLGSGRSWVTAHRGRSFSVEVRPDAISYTPEGKKSQRITKTDLAAFCERFHGMQSFAPKDYPDSFHKSYSLVLIRAFLEGRPSGGRGPLPRSEGEVLTAYFLARYSRLGDVADGRFPPPSETKLAKWEYVFRQLYSALGNGRDYGTFKNSMHGSITGIGMRLRAKQPLDPKPRRVVAPWMGRSRQELWEEVKRYFVVAPADTPRVARLRQRLAEGQPLKAPMTPRALRMVRRVINAYERSAAVTRYVKATRGDRCQVCGEPYFLKRNGLPYCEVHHIFQLSKNPTPDCLGPEFLVAVCANCHRMLHHADTGEPVRTAEGWRIRIGHTTREFSTRVS